ncbi:hypothetical protein AB0K09_04205 [Streptomyces sp. NPDC049577]|uniref:hypothetical protein n=1 Tax=Streptomyces sp. NPDC049577 TaxID=3155153 RepID=UPI003423F16D
MIPTNFTILALVCIGLAACGAVALYLVGGLVYVVVWAVRATRRPGRHRAPRGGIPTTAAAVDSLAGLHLLRRCAAEDRHTLHEIHADGSATCWVCQVTTPKGDDS